MTTGTSALVIAVDGDRVFELQTERTDHPIHIMSVTKSVVSLAIGRMLQDGSLTSLDMKLSEIFPQWRQGQKQKITLRHVLSHSSGIQDIPNAGIEIEPSPDVVKLALAAELTEAPGETFRYNNKASNLLALVVQELTGQAVDDYLRSTVFADLGIDSFDWLSDSAGNPYVMAGLLIRARDLLKIGQLMADGGRWQGRQVIDASFAREALTSQRTDNTRVGLLWWLFEGPPSGFQANGWLGQWLIVSPDRGLVAVRLVDREDAREQEIPQRFLDIVREIL